MLTLVLALTSVPHLRGRDVPFIVFALTPYLVLASLAAMGCFVRSLRSAIMLSWDIMIYPPTICRQIKPTRGATKH